MHIQNIKQKLYKFAGDFLPKFVQFSLFLGFWMAISDRTQLSMIICGIITSLNAIYIGEKLGINWGKTIIYKFNIFKFLLYLSWLLWEISMSAFKVMKIILLNKPGYNSVIIKHVNLQENKLGEAIYGNSITLTPGTICIYIENGILLYHALDVSFSEDLKSGDMDARVKNLFG